MLPVAKVYLLFFAVSLSLLFLIFCVKLPEIWRSSSRFFRQMAARRTRHERMLADLEKLMSEARRLEGIYCFEAVEPHLTPRQPAAETSSSPVSSNSSSAEKLPSFEVAR